MSENPNIDMLQSFMDTPLVLHVTEYQYMESIMAKHSTNPYLPKEVAKLLDFGFAILSGYNIKTEPYVLVSRTNKRHDDNLYIAFKDGMSLKEFFTNFENILKGIDKWILKHTDIDNLIDNI